MQQQLRIALIQSHLLWENPVANRKRFSDTMAQIASKVDLIIIPEMFTTGFTMAPANIPQKEAENTLAWMQGWAQEKDAAIMGSVVYPEEGAFYNRLWFVKRDKKEHYDKKHLFTLAGEHKAYRPGKKKVVLDYRGFKICPMICYDLRFPVWSRNTEDYDVLIYVANWPKTRISAWDALLKARAIENMAYCIGVNRVGMDGLGYQYSGHTAAYDALGRTLAYSEKEEILYVTLYKEHLVTNRKKLGFLADRDRFSWK